MGIENLGMNLQDTFRHYMPGDPPERGIPWIWQGPEMGGYGRLMADNKWWRAHVASYTLFVEPVPDGMFVLHNLDIPLDVNPNNLRLGTHLDNMRDMVARGRSVRGERHHMTFLKELEIIEIRKMADAGVTLREIAEIFGCSTSVAYKIITNKTWKYVPPVEKHYEKNSARGVDQGLAVLNDRLVLRMRQAYADGSTVAQICRDFNVKRSTLNAVLAGETWTHVPMPINMPEFGKKLSPRKAVDEDMVREMRRIFDSGEMNVREIAEHFDRKYTTVNNVVRRYTWKHVD